MFFSNLILHDKDYLAYQRMLGDAAEFNQRATFWSELQELNTLAASHTLREHLAAISPLDARFDIARNIAMTLANFAVLAKNVIPTEELVSCLAAVTQELGDVGISAFYNAIISLLNLPQSSQRDLGSIEKNIDFLLYKAEQLQLRTAEHMHRRHAEVPKILAESLPPATMGCSSFYAQVIGSLEGSSSSQPLPPHSPRPSQSSSEEHGIKYTGPVKIYQLAAAVPQNAVLEAAILPDYTGCSQQVMPDPQQAVKIEAILEPAVQPSFCTECSQVMPTPQRAVKIDPAASPSTAVLAAAKKLANTLEAVAASLEPAAIAASKLPSSSVSGSASDSGSSSSSASSKSGSSSSASNAAQAASSSSPIPKKTAEERCPDLDEIEQKLKTLKKDCPEETFENLEALLATLKATHQDLSCPVCSELMDDPVSGVDGNTYERRILLDCENKGIPYPKNPKLPVKNVAQIPKSFTMIGLTENHINDCIRLENVVNKLMAKYEATATAARPATF